MNPEFMTEPLTISEAKDVLRYQIYESGEFPSFYCVRDLSEAYLNDSATTIEEQENKIMTSGYAGTPPYSKFQVRYNRREVAIATDEDIAVLTQTAVTHHKKRLLLPGFAARGDFAFKGEPKTKAVEYIRLQDGKDLHEIRLDAVGETTGRLILAKALLDLPDEPRYVPLGGA